ncbi:MAG TPA: hypothetical protein VLJ79_33070 [Candidatus Binatia bacterium]|nr:hypothetical protein [Candidatus Binatia bacterium]
MPDIFFHLGLHKTGTTFLQREVFPKIDPEMFCFLGKMSSLMKYIIYQDPAYFDAEGIRARILEHAHPQKINLISNEDLSGDPLNGGIHRTNILSNLHSCFPNAKVLLFIRKQDDWALSNYLGSIRRGTNLPLRQFYGPALDYEKSAWQRRYPNPTLELFRYSPYIRRLKTLFGEDASLILPYEALKVDSDAVVRRLADFLQVKRPKYENVTRNYTWGKKRVAFHRMINLFVHSPQNPYGFIKGLPIYSFKDREIKYLTLRRLLVRCDMIDSYDRLIDRFDSKFTDNKNVCKRIFANCIDDNRRIQKDYGIELEPYGYLDCKI